MLRNLKFTLFLVVKSVLWQFTLFLRNLFCRDLRAFAWKKLGRKLYGGEKMTIMMCQPSSNPAGIHKGFLTHSNFDSDSDCLESAFLEAENHLARI